MVRMVKEEYGYLLPRGQEEGDGRVSGASGRISGRVSGASTIRTRSGRVVTAGLGLLLLASCRWSESPPPPPEDLLTYLESEGVDVTPVTSGVAYYEVSTSEPWAVHLLRVDLGRCELGLGVLEAPLDGGEGRGRNRVTDLVAAGGARVLAGVNGDFFTPEGAPVGTEVVDGRVRRVRARPALGWKPGVDPWMGTPTLDGDSSLSMGWKLHRQTGDSASQVIGGFPLLLQGGSRIGDLQVTDRPSFAAERHPRTAVGFDADDDVLWVVVVDGRQPGYSVGMSLPELAGLFESLQVEDAVNLDGGGSTVMVVGGRAVSRPSDAEGERPVVNALGILKDPSFCPGGH
jgi:hypothetical protein